MGRRLEYGIRPAATARGRPPAVRVITACQSREVSSAPPVSPERVRQERDRHVAFAFAAADLLIEAGVDGVIVAASGAAQSVLGQTTRSLLGKPLADILAPTDWRLVRRLLKQVQTLGRIDPIAVHLLRADDMPTRVLLGACRLPNSADSVFLSVTLLPTTLTETARPRDAATGLLTLDALRDMAERHAGQDGARELKLLRLDGLSGAIRHLPPDRIAMLMQEIGAALRASSLGGDAAGRLGDETFGLVARSDSGPIRDAALVADLREAFRGVGLSDGQIGPRLSRVEMNVSALSGGEVGRALAYAMNSFVNAQRDAFSIRSLRDGLTAVLDDTVSRFAQTRQIIGGRRFSLVFQPVVALTGRTLHHYEALSRFPGKANTFEMVGFMEEVGLVVELDLAVCKQAIAALEKHPGVKLAINLSGRSVQTEAFRKELGRLLTPAALGERLLFELTESAAVEHLEEAASFLTWLRTLGHMVCLDDFGAGAAAYSYLRRFDVDFLKIDGPFLQAAVNGPRERALIRSICVLCNEIGGKVIGEMIEDETAALMAKALGIDFGQGWLFGRPLRDLPKPVGVSRRKGASETWE